MYLSKNNLTRLVTFIIIAWISVGCFIFYYIQEHPIDNVNEKLKMNIEEEFTKKNNQEQDKSVVFSVEPIYHNPILQVDPDILSKIGRPIHEDINKPNEPHEESNYLKDVTQRPKPKPKNGITSFDADIPIVSLNSISQFLY